jgi:hydroxymethylbilane synthase
MLPAPGQGALAVQIREDDAATRALAQTIHCRATAACVTAERAFMHALGGGCRAPVAALAELQDGRVVLYGRVLSADGVQCFDGEMWASLADVEQAGRELARKLVAAGADRVLAALGGSR